MKLVSIDDAVRPPFLLAVEDHGSFFVLRLGGEIRTREIELYYDKMTAVIEGCGLHSKSILCDFGRVTGADTATIAALVKRLADFRRQGKGKLVFFNIPDTVCSLFQIARLANLFTLCKSQQEAEAALI